MRLLFQNGIKTHCEPHFRLGFCAPFAMIHITIYQYLGDFFHLASFFLLVYRLWKTKSAGGTSKTIANVHQPFATAAHSAAVFGVISALFPRISQLSQSFLVFRSVAGGLLDVFSRHRLPFRRQRLFLFRMHLFKDAGAVLSRVLHAVH
jgi:hypothetical protein